MNGTLYYVYPAKHLTMDTHLWASILSCYSVQLLLNLLQYSTELVTVDDNYTWAVLPTSEKQKKKSHNPLRVGLNHLDGI